MNSKVKHIVLIVEFLSVTLYIFLISFQWFLKESDIAITIQKTRIIQLVTGYLIVFSEIYFLKFITRLKVKRIANVLLSLFVIVAFSVTWNYISVQLAHLFNFSEPFSFKILFEKDIFKFTVFYLIPNSLFYCFYLLIVLWHGLTIQKQKALEAKAVANSAQLKMLQYQINPHFLFNTLNTVRYVIEEDKDQARHMITNLSDFFRYTLSKKDEHTDLLGNELEAVVNFLQVQKIRFDEKLDCKINCDKEIEKLVTPFFILYPLVENALKYGIKTSILPLKLEINIQHGENLKIEVKNSGRLIDSKAAIQSNEGTNTGIDNLKKRLSLAYNGNYSFSLYEKDNWVYAKILIPIDK